MLLPLPSPVAGFLRENSDDVRRLNVVRRQVPHEGPGTEFYKITKTLRLPFCGLCAMVLAEMNQLGTDGCERRFEYVLSRLRENAVKLRWRAKLSAVIPAIYSGLAFKVNPLDPLPGLLMEAIRLAREQQGLAHPQP